MRRPITRRDVLKSTAAIGAGLWLGSAAGAKPPNANEKLDIALIGIGGRGRANLNAVAGENIVALCDVDEKRAGDAWEKFPRAAKFHDFRRMFDAMEKHIDAVVVSTPDHTHFHPSMAALERGRHLFCEKPMAHSVAEVRKMTDLAREKKVATQLGVQRHTLDNMHRVVELIKGGAVGTVREIHSWIGGERGMPQVPGEFPPVPEHLKWDLWLGPAAQRPYHPTYCPYGWRFWWDFGTGETGNWGCHILDIPFWALDLTQPVRVEASGPPVHPQNTPKQMAVRYEFPAAGDRPAVTLHWYHAKSGPPILAKLRLSAAGNNTLFIGSDGMLLCGFGRRTLLPEGKSAAAADIGLKVERIPDSPGFHREWIDACRGGEPATCAFDYSGPLTETVLLGNVAYRAGGGFQWDARRLQTLGNQKAQALIDPPYRKGWNLEA